MQSRPTRFSDLVGANRKFQIPGYQRNYSWGKDQFEDLWRDLHTIIGTDKPHFMGTVLLQRNTGSHINQAPGVTVYDIIDGQQRLTTLIILLHLISEERREYDETTADNIRREYIEPNHGWKLILKNEDARYFQQEVLGGSRGTSPPRRSTNTNSEQQLQAAKEFFEEQLGGNRESVPAGFEDYQSYLVHLTDTILQLEFKSYDVESESEAVRIFEATNDRGKDLTNLERTKSFLMYQMHLCYEDDADNQLTDNLDSIRNEFKEMYRLHKEATEGMSNAPSSGRIQRYHFIIWHDSSIRTRNPAYQNYLRELKDHFRELENERQKVTAIKDYTQKLRGAFEAIKEIHTGSLGGSETEIRLERLFALNTVGNFYPLLIAVRLSSLTDENQFVDLLDRIETYTFRAYVLMDYRTNKRKNGFYVLARKINNGEKSVADVVEKIENYITWDCDDDQIDTRLGDERFFKNYGSKRIRYLLYFYDVYLSDSDAHLHLKFDEVVRGETEDYKITVEHIWPQNSSNIELTADEEEMYDEYKHRLGNLALMKHKENSSESNKSFDKKRPRYLRNEILMLNQIAEGEARAEWGDEQWDDNEWGIDQIEARENDIRAFVKRRWPDFAAAR